MQFVQTPEEVSSGPPSLFATFSGWKKKYTVNTQFTEKLLQDFIDTSEHLSKRTCINLRYVDCLRVCNISFPWHSVKPD